MKKILHAFLLLLLTTSALQAQTRQMLFADTTGERITFNDTRVDKDGNVVTIGGEVIKYGDGFVMKTNKQGDIIWKKKFFDGQLDNITIAANGDYLVNGGKNRMMIARIAPDGTLVWTSHTAFWTNASLSNTGITELANGDIAICGTNAFGYFSASFFDGWLQLFSGIDGTSKRQYAFTSTSGTGMFHFSGMTSKNDTLIIGGHHAPRFGTARNFILKADTLGNVASIKYFDSSIASNGKTLSMDAWMFRDMAVKGNKILISGVYRENPGNKEVLHVSVYDEVTDSISGRVYNLNGANLNGGYANITDTNEHYLAMNPDTAWTIAARIVNDTVKFAKVFRSENKTANGVSGQGDTAIVVGAIKGQALYAYIGSTSTTVYDCTVMDTSLVVTTYGRKLNSGVVPDVKFESLSSDYPIPEKADTLTQRTYLCPKPITGKVSELVAGRWSIYPNPSNGEFVIEGLSADKNVAVRITNIYGQEVHANKTTTGNKISIRLDAPAGVYFIVIATPEGKHTEKIVVR